MISVNFNIVKMEECLVNGIHSMLKNPQGRADLENMAALVKIIAVAGAIYAGFGIASAWKWISRYPIAGVVVGGTCAISAIALCDVMRCSHAIGLLCKGVGEIPVEKITQVIVDNSFVLGNHGLV